MRRPAHRLTAPLMDECQAGWQGRRRRFGESEHPSNRIQSGAAEHGTGGGWHSGMQQLRVRQGGCENKGEKKATAAPTNLMPNFSTRNSRKTAAIARSAIIYKQDAVFSRGETRQREILFHSWVSATSTTHSPLRLVESESKQQRDKKAK